MLAGPPLGWAAATLGGDPKERKRSTEDNITCAAALVSRAKTLATLRGVGMRGSTAKQEQTRDNAATPPARHIRHQTDPDETAVGIRQGRGTGRELRTRRTA